MCVKKIARAFSHTACANRTVEAHAAGIGVALFSGVKAACVLLAASTVGCVFVPEGRHAIRFDLVQEPAGTVITEHKSYFFWALAPTVEVDVLDKCPYGAVAIVDGSEGGGILTWLPTLGLWSRRSTTYYCRRPPTPDPEP
jgi:hypothetical protein